MRCKLLGKNKTTFWLNSGEKEGRCGKSVKVLVGLHWEMGL